MRKALPTEEDLHAYLDGELGEDRHAMVEAHLAQHPEDARRLQAYRADGEAIARIFSRADHLPDAAFSPFDSPPAAARTRVGAALWARGTPWQRAAAIALIVLGAAVVAFVTLRRDTSDDALWARFGRDAIVAHLSLSNPASQPIPAA